MHANLNMNEDRETLRKVNPLAILGTSDISLLNERDGRIHGELIGVHVFRPNTGEVVSSPDQIALWLIDGDYNASFYGRDAHLLDQNDPYTSLRTTLKAEINEEAWETLHDDTSRPFEKPKNGRIAVKVINHLGDEVMKVFRA